MLLTQLKFGTSRAALDCRREVRGQKEGQGCAGPGQSKGVCCVHTCESAHVCACMCVHACVCWGGQGRSWALTGFVGLAEGLGSGVCEAQGWVLSSTGWSG